jgi:hypothetical protein
VKLVLGEEVEFSDHTAEWLYSVHDQHYLTPGEVPDEALKLGLAEQLGPDSELTEKGRRVAKSLRASSKALVKCLNGVGVTAEPHARGVLLTPEVVAELIATLGRKSG